MANDHCHNYTISFLLQCTKVNFKVNKHGYVITNSRNTTTKILTVISDCQCMITRKGTSKQDILRLNLQKFTRSKQVVITFISFDLQYHMKLIHIILNGLN